MLKNLPSLVREWEKNEKLDVVRGKVNAYELMRNNKFFNSAIGKH
jgi:hypothetical protein